MFMVLMVSVRFWKESPRGATTSSLNIINGLKMDLNLKIQIFSHTTTNLIKKLLDFLGISYYLNNPIIKKVEKTLDE